MIFKTLYSTLEIDINKKIKKNSYSNFEPINLLQGDFQGNLWKNDSAIPLDEFQIKFNELNSYSYSTENNTIIFDYIQHFPNEFRQDELLIHKQLFNRVLNQLQNKLNTLPKVTRTFNGTFDTPSPFAFQNQHYESVELTIVEYLEKYKNYLNTDKSFKIKKIDSIIKKTGLDGSIINEINKSDLPKALKSLSCKSKNYKIKSESANLLRNNSKM
jgi:hypothetical protein